MKLLRRRREIAALTRLWSRWGLSIGFVPTMGALHRGHASLIRRARRRDDKVVVSVFVNPTQFGPNEDYSRYPRALAADTALCKAAGADALYHPAVEQVYPEGFSTSVEVAGLSQPLCGEFRPGHFKGVATVVLKLLETVRPTRAYFGEKDFQQLAVLARMARDLDLDAAIVGCPTVREQDGLALSSRNAYLSPEERRKAPLLYAALRAGAAAARRRGATPAAVLKAASAGLRRMGPVGVDYLSLVEARSLRPARRLAGELRLLAAIRLGRTRLIDNVPLSL